MPKIDEKLWKKLNKPAGCTQPPWKHLTTREEQRQIKQECIEIYGYSFDECSKRLVCFTKACLGRPLPWASPTARPYLEQLRNTQKIENDELYIQGCQGCPIANTCSSPCAQVGDFANRFRVGEVQIFYKENMDNFTSLNDTSDENVKEFLPSDLEIPWDALSTKRQEVIKQYLFKYKDFKSIADKLDLNNQARVKYEFYAGLTTLSEYAIMREFIESHYDELTDRQKELLTQVYIDNKTISEVAKHLGVSKQSAQQTIKRVINKYKLKWTTFVKKENNKVRYNIPQILK